MDSDSSSSDEDKVVIAVLLARKSSARASFRFNFNVPALDGTWKRKFRFEKDDILRLVDHFKLPDPFPTRQRYLVLALEAVCIFLRRMAYPARLDDLKDLFGRDEAAISSISNAVLEYRYDTYHKFLNFDQVRLCSDTLDTHARAIHLKGAPLRTCVGLIELPERNRRKLSIAL
ncbi:hypothetical protein F441_03368 [Phytophthora nicotianae CJ01A1]|uniref:Nuclease HARBI1 n=4 Tax=Phytophthora nicotianae TaxID=4792 RepID=V9FRR7_PHYNI|nr:hypothetical protein F443_03323 [Phytophthora nicotianae P1569]ETK93608.1 hypothetical protein L915_03245 [Phytophthora nicotianae]ETP23529.1 hypothetical protein F441_03368 [Phytophthora nicotianae CJ01A1]ETP51589.1 hypothetical protein F442_03293 [Phytophthora nicotianae P10297]ETL47001.1 hypothetical protein L916_03213 [Phytophthora nicotianae]